MMPRPSRVGHSDLFAGMPGPGAACLICSRPLTSPASVAAGIGPVCAGGKRHTVAPKGRTDMQRHPHHAQFTVIERDGCVLVEDLDQGRSVTNDADWVVDELRRRGFDLTQPLIYRDTTGRWDGLGVRDGRFGWFYVLAPNLPDALAKVKAMRRDGSKLLGDAVKGEG